MEALAATAGRVIHRLRPASEPAMSGELKQGLALAAGADAIASLDLYALGWTVGDLPALAGPLAAQPIVLSGRAPRRAPEVLGCVPYTELLAEPPTCRNSIGRNWCGST